MSRYYVLAIILIFMSEEAFAQEGQHSVSSRKTSGEWANWSDWYSLCTDPLPSGYRISAWNYNLHGDRSCGAWANCEVTTDESAKKCVRFQMQGHNEGGGNPVTSPWFGNGNNGARDSELTINYTVTAVAPPPPSAPSRPSNESWIKFINTCSFPLSVYVKWKVNTDVPYTVAHWAFAAGDSNYLKYGSKRVTTTLSKVYWYASGGGYTWDAPIASGSNAVNKAEGPDGQSIGLRVIAAPAGNQDVVISPNCNLPPRATN